MKWGMFHDPMIEHAPIEVFDDFVTNDDGSVSFKVGEGYVSQEPNAPGTLNIAGAIGVYEKWGGGTGVGVKTSWTRPAENDKVISYFVVQLPNC